MFTSVSGLLPEDDSPNSHGARQYDFGIMANWLWTMLNGYGGALAAAQSSALREIVSECRPSHPIPQTPEGSEVEMDRKSETDTQAEAKKRAEARRTLLVAVILGGIIVALIAGMMAIDIYAERLEASTSKVHDAADP